MGQGARSMPTPVSLTVSITRPLLDPAPASSDGRSQVRRWSSQSSSTVPRHRIAGVGGEIEQDLLDLPWIDFHDAEFRGQAAYQGDILARSSGAASDVDRSIDGVEIGLSWGHDLPTAEGEELARQRRGALAGLANLFDGPTFR